MEDSKQILNLPFDESDGSTTAHDYSQSRKNAAVHDCEFVSGKQGKAIRFDGNGYAEITDANFDLLGDFTLLAWIKPDGNGVGVCLQHGTDAEDQVQKDYTVQRGTWAQWAIVKEGLTVMIYKDGALLDTVALPAQLVGLGINQPDQATDNGVGCIDEVRLYDVAATQEEVGRATAASTELVYSINGKPFSTWGIVVQDSDGILDRPAMKTPFSQDWPSYHGEVVDLDKKRFQPRDISLKCWMPCVSKLDFVNKWNDFCSQFEADGTQRLMISIHPTHPLVYEVYLREALNVSKKWNEKLFVCTFTLKVREPDPVKRVVRFMVNEDGEQHTIKLNTPDIVTVAWGDGEFSHNVYGDHTTAANSLKHTYTHSGIYYAIVSGNIDEIDETTFETDGIIVWSKL